MILNRQPDQQLLHPTYPIPPQQIQPDLTAELLPSEKTRLLGRAPAAVDCSAVPDYHNINLSMRLLLLNSRQSLPPAPRAQARRLAETLTPVFENILTKKCVLQEDISSHEGNLHFWSTLETDLPAYTFRMKLEVATLQRGAIYSATLMRNGSPLVVCGEMRVNLMHKVNRKSLAIDNHTLEIDTAGQIALVSKIAYSKLLFASPSQLMREVDARLRTLVKAALALLHPILLQTNYCSRSGEEIRAARAMHVQKVKRHIYFSCYDLGLSEKASEYRHPTEQTLKQREKIIKNLLGSETQAEDLKEGRLFGLQEGRVVENSKQWRREFESTYYFQKLLQVPVPKTASPAENIFIFNEIIIDRPEQLAVQDLPGGGGCLKVMAVNAAYVAGKEQNKDKQQFMQKVLVAKTAKGQSGRQRGKLMHERNIVKLFNSAHSGYLLKYYTCNQPNFAYKNALLMDYHSANTPLLDYLQLRRDSLSVQGKLALLAQLSNGLRFLAYYKVVHMDLTLSNVLVFDNYLPKIIDFGEAYHSETIETTIRNAYVPGFTLPYCAPEVFKNKQFCSAQDMFSFGIIIYRILMNALPFFPADSLINVYKAGLHHQRYFLAPQALTSICNQQVCFLLLQLINICMRAQEDGRPLPIWTTIILKEILTEVFL